MPEESLPPEPVQKDLFDRLAPLAVRTWAGFMLGACAYGVSYHDFDTTQQLYGIQQKEARDRDQLGHTQEPAARLRIKTHVAVLEHEREELAQKHEFFRLDNPTFPYVLGGVMLANVIMPTWRRLGMPNLEFKDSTPPLGNEQKRMLEDSDDLAALGRGIRRFVAKSKHSVLHDTPRTQPKK